MITYTMKCLWLIVGLWLTAFAACSKSKGSSSSETTINTPMAVDDRLLPVVKRINFDLSTGVAFRETLGENSTADWANAIVDTRGIRLVALVPVRQHSDGAYTRFVAIEQDEQLRFKLYTDDWALYADNTNVEAPPAFKVRAVLNALNYKAYGIQPAPNADVKSMDRASRMAVSERRLAGQGNDLQQERVITVITCIKWYTCIGDGKGNCVGKIYEHEECVSSTVWTDDMAIPFVPKGSGGKYPGSSTGGGGSAPPAPDPKKVPPADVPVQEVSQYIMCFNAAKPAKLVVYADQPMPGMSDPKSILGGVGHAFITLEQVNGTTTVRRTMGFYPKFRIDPLLNQGSESAIGDDSRHHYDVRVEYPITGEQLKSAMDAILGYNPTYHLSGYNCTNFVLDVAGAAGIVLPRTKSWWGTGSGLNPGAFGEDLRKQTNVDTKAGTAPANSGSCE